jgi:hypothetical protein
MNALVTQHAQPVSDLERMARAFAASKLFGVQNVDQALALMLVAQAEGRHPASAAQDYHIISGRPAKKADAMLRDFLAAGGKVEWHTLTDEQADATFSHPAGGSARIDWTAKRAQQAGIANPMWKKYPRQMLRSRVVSEGVRTVCPGATSGMYVPEEVQDIVHETVRRVPDDTPADLPDGVMTGAQLQEQQAADPPPSKAALKRSGVYEELRDGIDACETEEELVAWDKANYPKCKALPQDWHDALGDRYQARQLEIQGASSVAEEAAEMDAAFQASVGRGGAGGVAGSDRDAQAAA